MTDAGDVHVADLNEKRRRPGLVVSNRRFNELSGRVLVAPEIGEDPHAVTFHGAGRSTAPCSRPT